MIPHSAEEYLRPVAEAAGIALNSVVPFSDPDRMISLSSEAFAESRVARGNVFAAFFKMEGVMDFRLWGSLVMVVGMIGILIVIYSYSAKAVEEENKRRRYEERMRILMESDQEAK